MQQRRREPQQWEQQQWEHEQDNIHVQTNVYREDEKGNLIKAGNELKQHSIQKLFTLLCFAYWGLHVFTVFSIKNKEYHFGVSDVGVWLVKNTEIFFGFVGAWAFVASMIIISIYSSLVVVDAGSKIRKAIIVVSILCVIISGFSFLYGYDDVNTVQNILGKMTVGFLTEKVFGELATHVIYWLLIAYIVIRIVEGHTQWRLSNEIYELKKKLKDGFNETKKEILLALPKPKYVESKLAQQTRESLKANEFTNSSEIPISSNESLRVNPFNRDKETIPIVDKTEQKPITESVEIKKTIINEVDTDRKAYPKPKDDKFSVHFGKDEFGMDMFMDIRNFPHLLVGGVTGYGKSNFMNLLITQLISKNPPNKVKFIFFDMKEGVEFGEYEKIPHLRFPVATTSEECIALLPKVIEEFKNRQRIIRDAGYKSLKEWQESEPEKAIPNLIVFFDETGEMLEDNKKENIPQLKRLLKLSRSAGMSCVLADQYPKNDTLPTNITSQCVGRVAFYLENEIQSRVILGSGGAELIKHKGQCIFKHGAERFLVKTIECKTNYIRDIVNDAISKYGMFTTNELAKQVVILLKEGKNQVQIAEQLGITQVDLSNILQKLRNLQQKLKNDLQQKKVTNGG